MKAAERVVKRLSMALRVFRDLKAGVLSLQPASRDAFLIFPKPVS